MTHLGTDKTVRKFTVVQLCSVSLSNFVGRFSCDAAPVTNPVKSAANRLIRMSFARLIAKNEFRKRR